MDFDLTIEKVAGVGDRESCSSILNRRITFGDGTVGTIVGCVLAKSAKDETDLALIIRDLFELAVDKLEGLESGVLETLEHVRDLSVNFIGELAVEVDFAYVVFYKDACYIVRLNDRVKIEVFDPPKSTEIKFSSGSGPVKPGQIYVIATEGFFSLFDTAVFSKEAEIEFGEIIDGLATEISAQSEQSEIGAVFVQVKPSAQKATGPEGEEKETETKAVAGEIEEEKEVVGDETEEEVETTEKEQETEKRPQTIAAAAEMVPERVDRSAVWRTRLKNLLPIILSAILRETRKLAAHDIRAMGRLRKNIVFAALLVLVILVGSVSYAFYKNQQNKKLEELNLHLTAASTKLSEGTAITGLNRARAREIFIEADREVDLAIVIDDKNERAKSLKEEIAKRLAETEETTNINFETTFEASVGLVSLSPSGADLIAVGGEKIFEVDVANRSSEEVVGAVGTRGATVYDSKVFSMTDSQVVRVDVASGKSDRLFDHSGAQDIGVFLGNVYLLSGGGIDKYVPIESGYSGPSDYLVSPGEFGKNSRFAIDGLIWVSSGNKIFKFNRGEKQDFEISGAPLGIGELGVIYTDAGLASLYVIDVTNSALLVINKDGTYQGSYQSPEFSRASDLVVSSDEKKLYITAGTKVLEAVLE